MPEGHAGGLAALVRMMKDPLGLSGSLRRLDAAMCNTWKYHTQQQIPQVGS
jgi:hypothetical protein